MIHTNERWREKQHPRCSTQRPIVLYLLMSWMTWTTLTRLFLIRHLTTRSPLIATLRLLLLVTWRISCNGRSLYHIHHRNIITNIIDIAHILALLHHPHTRL